MVEYLEYLLERKGMIPGEKKPRVVMLGYPVGRGNRMVADDAIRSVCCFKTIYNDKLGLHNVINRRQGNEIRQEQRFG
jgi:hypothetical protein